MVIKVEALESGCLVPVWVAHDALAVNNMDKSCELFEQDARS